MMVGAEGTGHGFIVAVKNHMFRTNDQLVGVPSEYMITSWRYHIRTSMDATALRYSSNLAAAKTDMRKMAEHGAQLQFPGTIALFKKKNSYPDGHPPKKVLKYVDLRMLAEVAEAEGVDLRVLYLQRPVKELIIADTVHRHFHMGPGRQNVTSGEQLYLEYMQVVITDIAVMHSFLAELDPAFVVCHDYTRIGDVEQASKVADFLAPTAEVAEALQESFMAVGHVHNASNETLPYQGADVIASRLQRKLDSFESLYCAER
eukprot:jgi/Undpi1/7617/HiC_scaffold_23.g10090.m1